MKNRTIYLARPSGFCAGVQRAVETAAAALDHLPGPVYALHELVHNPVVIKRLTTRDMRFVETLDSVPAGATVLFSAHGVPPAIRRAATERQLHVIDATCPLVEKVHAAVRRHAAAGYSIALIGQPRHVEVIGIVGEAPDRVTVIETPAAAEQYQPADPDRVAVAMQTTLSREEAEKVVAVLRRRFPTLRIPAGSDICYATTNRQQAVRDLARVVRTILVLGGRQSSNTRRLVEVATAAGAIAHLLTGADELEGLPLNRLVAIGITAGASTPQSVIDQVLEALGRQGFNHIEVVESVRENTRFRLPEIERG